MMCAKFLLRSMLLLAQKSCPPLSSQYKKILRQTYKKNLLKALCGLGDVPTAVVAGSDYEEQYVVNMTVGGQNFAVLMDTGS